jgi:Spy/CpxP family protein refolding chaperone
MRSRSWISLAFIAVLLASPVDAQPRRMGPGGGGPDGLMAPFMGVMRLSDLSDQQKKDIQALLDRQRESGRSEVVHLMELQHRLAQAVLADTPNIGTIEDLKSQIAAAEAKVREARIDLQMQIAQVLTPEQRKTLRERPVPARPGMRGGQPHRQMGVGR